MDEDMQEERWNRLARTLYRTVRRYYEDPEHRKEFEERYLKEYGTPYHWKTLAEIKEEQK